MDYMYQRIWIATHPERYRFLHNRAHKAYYQRNKARWRLAIRRPGKTHLLDTVNRKTACGHDVSLAAARAGTPLHFKFTADRSEVTCQLCLSRKRFKP